MATQLVHQKITEIPNTEPAATPALWNTRYDEIDENFDRLAAFHPVGTSSTAAATQAKTVAIDGFALAANAFVLVKFSAANSASAPTLNVSGTGAKAIYFNGSAVPAAYLEANKYYRFVYDGTHWVLTGDVDVRHLYLPLTGGTITGSLTVTGTSTLTGKLTANGGVTTKALVATSLDLNGNGDVSGSLTVHGDLNAQGGLSVTDITATGTTTVVGLNAGNVSASGTLTVNGTTTMTGKLAANGGIATKALSATSITNFGAMTNTGNLTVNGSTTLKALTATGLDLNGNGDVSGSLTVHGDLNAQGGLSVTDITATGTTTVVGLNAGNISASGTLAVNGATTLTGKLTANGGISTKTLTATGLDLNGNGDVSGTLVVHGKSTLEDAQVNGNLVVGEGLQVTGETATVAGKQVVLSVNSKTSNSSGNVVVSDVLIGGEAGDLASDRGQIGDNNYVAAVDFNLYTKSGVYPLNKVDDAENCPPTGTNGFLIVYASASGHIRQTFYRIGTPGINDDEIYTRTYAPSATTVKWGEWYRVILSSNISSQSQSEEGSDNSTLMTPLQVRNALNDYGFAYKKLSSIKSVPGCFWFDNNSGIDISELPESVGSADWSGMQIGMKSGNDKVQFVFNSKTMNVRYSDNSLGSEIWDQSSWYQYDLMNLAQKNEVMLLDGSNYFTGEVFKWSTPTKSYNAFRVIEGDSAGAAFFANGMGGLTAIGSGESCASFQSHMEEEGFAPTNEQLFLLSDNGIYFVTDANDWANRVIQCIHSNGWAKRGKGTVKGEEASSIVYFNWMLCEESGDATANRFGGLEVTRLSDKTVKVELKAYGLDSGSTAYERISIWRNADGSVTTYAPSPVTDSHFSCLKFAVFPSTEVSEALAPGTSATVLNCG